MHTMTSAHSTRPGAPAARRVRAAAAGWRYRLGVGSRALAAIVGGYALAGLASAVLALTLPATRSEAAITGTLTAFVVYPCAVMWVFAVRSAWRAWLGLAVPAALLGAVVALHYYARSGA